LKHYYKNMKNSEKIFESVKKGLINENLTGYVDLQPISNLEASPKEDFENKFAEFLAEDKKKDDEAVKVEEKKVSKHVEELESHNFDYKDPKNLDNQIGQEVMNGVYFESKQNPNKTIEEIKEMVSKNLAKDGQYYIKNAAFGIKGIGYQETELEEVSGKYASSGYSDKLKTIVKESLMGGSVVSTGNPNSISTQQNEIVKEISDELEEKKQGYDDREDESLGARRGAEKDKEQSMKDRRDDSYGKFGKRDDEAEGKTKGPGKNKVKKESLDNDLAEIDRQAQIVAMEAKLDKLSEVIGSKSDRINMVTEDDNLSELIDKKKMKQMQKEVKILEKRKAKMEKIYEKMCGKKYQKEEIVDEEMVNGVEVEEVSLENG
tara:strand:- start:96 stop:1223 length:1128 start_codon:yes stop_codon:yes gene_type:complete